MNVKSLFLARSSKLNLGKAGMPLAPTRLNIQTNNNTLSYYTPNMADPELATKAPENDGLEDVAISGDTKVDQGAASMGVSSIHIPPNSSNNSD